MNRKLGPTGKYPGGRYTKDDEGELALAIAADPRNRKVVINFGKPVAWLAFSPDEADALARTLMQKAQLARGELLEGK